MPVSFGSQRIYIELNYLNAECSLSLPFISLATIIIIIIIISYPILSSSSSFVQRKRSVAWFYHVSIPITSLRFGVGSYRIEWIETYNKRLKSIGYCYCNTKKHFQSIYGYEINGHSTRDLWNRVSACMLCINRQKLAKKLIESIEQNKVPKKCINMQSSGK